MSEEAAPSDCRFCRVNALLDDAAVAETQHHYILASRDRGLPEAVMIIPHRHHVDPFSITAQEWADMPKALQAAQDHLHRYDPEGFSICWNVGTAGGQTVDHVHLHVIALKSDDAARGAGLRALLKRKLRSA